MSSSDLDLDPDSPFRKNVETPKAADPGAGGGDQLPVYLDDDAVESMTGETMDSRMGGDSDEAARLVGSGSATGGALSKRAAPQNVGIGWFKALVLILFVQFLLLLALGAVFRGPLTQAYNKMVDRGFVEPFSLPWEGERTASTAVGDVAWEDVRRRYELTLLADAAIARADRGAMDELRAQLDIEDDPTRRAAARAEVFRVQQMYASASRLPGEPLPATQLFPGRAEEKDLSEDELITLLGDPDRDSEARLRAAWLLSGHRTLTANDALILAARKDPNLDVVKEAMQSFQKNTGYPDGDPFATAEAEQWWMKNAARLAKEFSSGTDATAAPAVPEAAVPAKVEASPSSPAPAPAPAADAASPTEQPAAPRPDASDDQPELKKSLRPIPEGSTVPAQTQEFEAGVGF